MVNLPDYIFKSMFRVDRTTFDEILVKVEEKLPPIDTDMAAKSVKGNKGQPLPTKVKLMATLRNLAGGIKWDICLAFKIGFGTFWSDSKFGAIWPIMGARNGFTR